MKLKIEKEKLLSAVRREGDVEVGAGRIETAQRVNFGIQCPECFGVWVSPRPRQPHDPYRYQCDDCGCQWSVDKLEGAVREAVGTAVRDTVNRTRQS